MPFPVSPSPGGCLHPDSWPLSVFKASRGGPCLSHVVPVVLALLPRLLPSEGPGALRRAHGPPRLASGFEGPLTCSLDFHPRPVPPAPTHIPTSSLMAGIGLETFRGNEVGAFFFLLPTKKKKSTR